MRRILLLVLALGAVGCTRNIEVEKALSITDVHTGWYDAGIQEDGKNKLVPSISFRLRNASSEPVRSVQVMAKFVRVTEPDVAWGEHFARAIERDGLAPNASTNPLVLRSNLGYTGTEPRMQMLQNRQFVDAKVEIYGRHGSRPMTKMAEYPIDRQLLTQ